MKLLRSLFLLAGLAALPACAASEFRNEVKPIEPATTIQQAQTLAPAAAADLAAPRSFVVLFDFDSADIRASAMQILYEASQVAGKAKPTAIRIHGFTDGSGNRTYNQQLSERRAKAVADQLTKLGVNVATVETKGFGKTNPASKTKGKAKDNRRVEIVFEGGDTTEITTDSAQTATAKPYAAAPTKVAIATVNAVPPALTAATYHFSPPTPLQTVGKHAIKRDRVQIGTAWIPPASAMADFPGRMGGRAV